MGLSPPESVQAPPFCHTSSLAAYKAHVHGPILWAQ